MYYIKIITFNKKYKYWVTQTWGYDIITIQVETVKDIKIDE